MEITAVILTKNNEKIIEACLTNLQFCHEIVVVDDDSSDQTREIAQRLGAKVFTRPLGDDFSQQRNFGLSKAGGEWVLFVDTDEKVTKDLREEILQAVNSCNSNVNGFFLTRQDYFFGSVLKYGENRHLKLLRLARGGKGQWFRRVHEVWKVEGTVGKLYSPLFHHQDNNLTSFLNKINFYSTLHAMEYGEEGVRSNLVKIIFYPGLKLLNNSIFKLGFLDKTPGLVMALFMSLHSFLAWSKLWMMQNTKE